MNKKSKKQELEKTKLQADLDEILRRVDSLPVLDPRSEDEIIGYDEHGLPS